jgi:dipeptidyl aminopeptidase/acylaminoacyl peptidase
MTLEPLRLAAVLLAVAGAPAHAQPAPAPAAPSGRAPAASAPRADAVARTVEAIAKIRSASSPSFSPDGKRLAYVSNESGIPQVWVMDLAGGKARQLTQLQDPVQSVHWSPAGDWLAYDVAPGGGLNVQVFVMKPDGTGVERLTAGGQENNQLAGWTRDGRFVRAATAQRSPAAFDPVLIDPATGAAKTVVEGRGITSVTSVSADGRLAVVYRLVSRGDSNLSLVDLASGAETVLTPHEGQAQYGWGEFSPDGRRIYVTTNGGRDLLAFGVIELDASGKPGPVQLLAERPNAEAEGGALSHDGRRAALLWNVAGRSELDLLDTRTGKLTPGPRLPVDLLGGARFSKDGALLALVGSGATKPGDIYTVALPGGRVVQRTRSTHAGVDLARLVRPTLVTYPAHDGLQLSGWLYRPAGARGPGPVVFSYHGGPEGQSRPGLSDVSQALVARGISVFLPNVRGSSGFGKRFMSLDNGAKRVDGVRDIQATTDHLVAAGIADPKRLGIMGGSYGGYMVMAGVTEYPDMFAAGANLFGVVNFDTFFKNTQPWMAAISTVEYGDPKTEAEMLKSLSPIHKLDRIKTPLIVLHGANDTNVPLIEAEQIVADLKRRNIPVEYVLFPDEGHGWRKLPNRVRSTTEIVKFFDQRLNGGGAARQ